MDADHEFDQDRWGSLGALLHVVYEIDDRERMLTRLFQGLREVLRFSSGVFLGIDAQRLQLREGFAFDCADSTLTAYLDHYAAFDPYVLRGPANFRINQSVRLSELIDDGALGRSAFIDFMQTVPYRHALAAVCGYRGRPLAAFCIHRPPGQPDFTTEDGHLISALAPHLGRSLALRAWLAHHSARESSGLLAFDERGQLVFRDAAAERLLEGHDVVELFEILTRKESPSMVVLADQHYGVERLAWQPSSLLTRFMLPEESAGTSALMTREVREALGKAERGMIVRLRRFEQRHDLCQRLRRYGLSPREVRIAEQAIVSHLSNADLADRQHISAETLKSHLREVYRKTQTRNRRELILKVLGLKRDGA